MEIRKAGVTIYFTLMMLVLFPLLLWSIRSAMVSAGRMRSANAVDQAMFSLFANYDRELRDRYNLYFINAGEMGKGPKLSACVKYLEDAMEYILKPNKGTLTLAGKNLLSLKHTNSFITDYTLATDAGGIPFETEAVRSMQDSAALSIVNGLQDKLAAREQAEREGGEVLEATQDVDYDSLEEQGRQARAEREEALQNGEEVVEYEVPENFINPLPLLTWLYQQAILGLVLPNGRSVSGARVNRSSLLSGRTQATGMGVLDARGSGGYLDDLTYIAWIVSHFGSFTEPDYQCGLEYQLEYMLYGKHSDEDNLKEALRELVLLRHAANALCLGLDNRLGQELDYIADIVSRIFMLPVLGGAIKAVLVFFCSYLESLVDVSALLQGKRVALKKDENTWQTDLWGFVQGGLSIQGMAEDAPGGLNYEEYLGGLILVMHRGTLTSRAMDMVESHMRGAVDPSFRLDACVYSLGVEMEIRSEKRVTFPVRAELSYADL